MMLYSHIICPFQKITLRVRLRVDQNKEQTCWATDFGGIMLCQLFLSTFQFTEQLWYLLEYLSVE